MTSLDGLTFYAEPDGRRVVAVFGDPFGTAPREAVSAVFAEIDAPTVSAVFLSFLSICRQVDEAEARRIHPRFFAQLDALPELDLC